MYLKGAEYEGYVKNFLSACDGSSYSCTKIVANVFS